MPSLQTVSLYCSGGQAEGFAKPLTGGAVGSHGGAELGKPCSTYPPFPDATHARTATGARARATRPFAWLVSRLPTRTVYAYGRGRIASAMRSVGSMRVVQWNPA